MDCSQALVCVTIATVTIVTVAIVSGKLLHRAGYEQTPLMVLSAGVIAGSARAYLSFRANRTR